MPDSTTKTSTANLFGDSPAGAIVLTPAAATANVASAGIGVTSGSVKATSAVTTADSGKSYNYTLVIQLPIPLLNVNVALTPSFVLAALGLPTIPKALIWFQKHAEEYFKTVTDLIVKLIRAIPELTVTVLVKVGPITVVNLQFIAKKVPFEVPMPSFTIPSLIADLNFDLSALIPHPPPIIIEVPVPVPHVDLSHIRVNGGLLAAKASVGSNRGGSSASVGTTTGGVSIQPPLPENMVKLPVI